MSSYSTLNSLRWGYNRYCYWTKEMDISPAVTFDRWVSELDEQQKQNIAEHYEYASKLAMALSPILMSEFCEFMRSYTILAAHGSLTFEFPERGVDRIIVTSPRGRMTYGWAQAEMSFFFRDIVDMAKKVNR